MMRGGLMYLKLEFFNYDISVIRSDCFGSFQYDNSSHRVNAEFEKVSDWDGFLRSN